MAQNRAMQFHFIANQTQASTSGRTIPVIDPSDGQAYDEIQRGSTEDIDVAVRATEEAIGIVCGRGAAS